MEDGEGGRHQRRCHAGARQALLRRSRDEDSDARPRWCRDPFARRRDASHPRRDEADDRRGAGRVHRWRPTHGVAVRSRVLHRGRVLSRPDRGHGHRRDPVARALLVLRAPPGEGDDLRRHPTAGAAPVRHGSGQPPLPRCADPSPGGTGLCPRGRAAGPGRSPPGQARRRHHDGHPGPALRRESHGGAARRLPADEPRRCARVDEGDDVSSICGDLNVLEMGSGSIAASMVGMVLADAGARVLKIEPPDGDRLRVENRNGFLVWNRGKESVVADLRTPEGRDRVLELAAAADVVIEGFAPGTADPWGVGAEALTGRNPRLVHCSITAFGRTGPYAGVKGFDSLVAAKVGLWARGAFGHRAGPILYPVPWASFGAAMQAVAGVMGALVVREKTGRGQRLDASLVNGLEPLEYFVGTIAQLMVKHGLEPSMDSRDMASATRYGMLMVTRDGRIVQTSTLLPHQAKALCEVAGIAHVIDEPRFSRVPMFDTPEDAQE